MLVVVSPLAGYDQHVRPDLFGRDVNTLQGFEDASYLRLFEPVMEAIPLQSFNPYVRKGNVA
jgi:hypothetical protein